MKKLLGIVVLGLLLSGNAYAEIINLSCSEYKGYGNFKKSYVYPSNLNYRIDTDKKTYEWKTTAQPNWTKMVILEWNGTTIKAKDPDPAYASTTELFNYANLKMEIIEGNKKVKGHMQLICKNTGYEKQKNKIEIADMINKAKDTCKSLGFKEGTEKFADCSLKLYSQSVELAAEQKQTIVMQPQSSGSNVMTIYDPVRDSNALMNKGMNMLSGGCTLGINC